MKRKNLLAISLIFAAVVNANCQEVIATSGGHGETTSGSLSWTIGEPITEAVSNNQNTLTQGFQQSKLTVVDISEKQTESFNIKVFPNPTSDFITIKSNQKIQEEMKIELMDLNGKLLLQNQELVNSLKINMQTYNPATYLLKITAGDKIKTYQIIKK